MQLSTYNPGKPQQPFSFYVLCKGNNSGKPLATHCPNCFLCVCDSQPEKDFYFWLCFGLWKGKCVEPILCGSVIPFIRINEFRQLLQSTTGQMDQLSYLATVQKVLQLDERETIILQQLQLLRQLKMAMLRQHMQR